MHLQIFKKFELKINKNKSNVLSTDVSTGVLFQIK